MRFARVRRIDLRRKASMLMFGTIVTKRRQLTNKQQIDGDNSLVVVDSDPRSSEFLFGSSSWLCEAQADLGVSKETG